MKKRVISAIVALAIFIPIAIIGGNLFNIAFYILAMLGLKEFLKIYDKKVPDFIQIIAYLMLTFIYFLNTVKGNLTINMDLRIMAGLFLTLFLPVVLYHDPKTYSIKDAFYFLGGIYFISSSFSMFGLYRKEGLSVLVFLFLITILTDTFAYITGSLIGKNKLLENISPNKTWEGTIGGSLIATFICSIYYFTIISEAASVPVIVLMILFLTLIGQFGDLFFSAIKRNYGVKDFSNIMPGHGGILDRFDSIIFVMLAFSFFITII